MLQRFFTNPVELSIQNRTVIFNSVDDFEFTLDARTAIPLDKIIDTIKASISELQLEADAIAVAREKLSRLMSQSPETSSGLNMRLNSINSSIFSKDNGWRDIIVSLNGNDSLESCKYKQIALKTYLRYLSNRLGMIKVVQHKLENIHNSKAAGVNASEIKTSALEIINESDSTIHSPKTGMTSMPKGRPVIIKINIGDKIELLLSKYKCDLLVGNEIIFIDSNDIEYPIKTGKNKIGRGQGCNVKLRNGIHEISRVHLVIVNHNNKKLELTDLSTHGTYYLHARS